MSKTRKEELEEKQRKINELKLKNEQRLKEKEKSKKETLNSRNNDITSKVNNELLEQVSRSKESSPVKPGNPNAQDSRSSKLDYAYDINEVSIASKDKTESYEAEVQCDMSQSNAHKKQGMDDDNVENLIMIKQMQMRMRNRAFAQEQIPVQKEKEPQKEIKTDQDKKIKIYTEDEWKKSKNDETFKFFLEGSLKIVEKAVNFDSTDSEKEFLHTKSIKDEKKSKLSKKRTFVDNTICEGKLPNYLEWSPTIPRLFMGIYSVADKNALLPITEGNILIWNVEMQTRPEFYCSSHSTITSACFHPFSNQLIVGGLATGQMALWDLRAKHLPSLRTQIDSSKHMFSINQVKVLGESNAYNITSLSLDGRLTRWNLENSNEFTSTLTLSFNKENKNEQSNKMINPTCMVFPKGDVNNFFMGTESGSLLECSIYAVESGRKTDENKKLDNENIKEEFVAHDATITSISILESNLSNTRTNGLLLTSSFDWTVNLYHPKKLNKPLLTFDTAEDYVNDVQWNPAHPGMFAMCDCDGTLQLYNLLKDTDYSIDSVKDPNRDAIVQNRWSKDGTSLITSSTNGEINLYSIEKEQLKFSSDTLDDFEKSLNKTLKDKIEEKSKKQCCLYIEQC